MDVRAILTLHVYHTVIIKTVAEDRDTMEGLPNTLVNLSTTASKNALL
jgi:hypothetical protein